MEKRLEEDKKKKIIKEIITYASIIIIVVLIRTFIITPIRVSGPSMNDTLKNGQIILLKKIDKNIKRFDVVIFKYRNEKYFKMDEQRT